MTRSHRSAATNSILMLGGQIAAKGTLLVSMMILSAYLGDHDFGVLALGIAVGQMLFFATDMGVSITLNRKLSIAPADGSRLLGAASSARILLSALGMTILAGGVWASSMKGGSPSVMLLVGIGYCFDSFAELTFSVFRSSERMGGESAARIAGGLAGVAAVSAVAVLDAGAEAAAAAYCVRALVSLAASAVLLRRMGAGGIAPSWDLRTMSALLRESWPLGVMGLLMVAWQRLDNVILGLWLGPGAVGAWQECYRLLDTLILLVTPTLLPGALFPSLCRALEESRERFEEALRGLAQLVTGLSILSGIFIAAGGTDLLRLLWGHDYLRGQPESDMVLVTLIMAASAPVIFWMNFLLASLLAAGRQRMIAAIAAAGLATSVLVNAVLPGILGIKAPALALAASSLVLCTLFFRALRNGRPLRIFGSLRTAFIPLVPAAAVMLVLRDAAALTRMASSCAAYALVWWMAGGLRLLSGAASPGSCIDGGPDLV